jgi:hypothetical protein
MKHRDRTLTEIAGRHLNIPTLRTRKSDSLDFHDVSVWAVRSALKAAFDAGTRLAGKDAEPTGTPQHVAAAMQTSLLVPKGTPLVPGKMYLRLYHGRTRPIQTMDWGFAGPTFGPLSCYVHTFCHTFRIQGDCDTSEVWLEKLNDMIHWDGCFYGDLDVFIASDDDLS